MSRNDWLWSRAAASGRSAPPGTTADMVLSLVNTPPTSPTPQPNSRPATASRTRSPTRRRPRSVVREGDVRGSERQVPWPVDRHVTLARRPRQGRLRRFQPPCSELRVGGSDSGQGIHFLLGHTTGFQLNTRSYCLIDIKLRRWHEPSPPCQKERCSRNTYPTYIRENFSRRHPGRREFSLRVRK